MYLRALRRGLLLRGSSSWDLPRCCGISSCVLLLRLHLVKVEKTIVLGSLGARFRLVMASGQQVIDIELGFCSRLLGGRWPIVKVEVKAAGRLLLDFLRAIRL